jgi:hypothetical protein
MQFPSLQRMRFEKSVSSLSVAGAGAAASSERPQRWQKRLSLRTSAPQAGQARSPKDWPQWEHFMILFLPLLMTFSLQIVYHIFPVWTIRFP